MIRPALKVADIFRECGAQYRHIHGTSMSREQYRAMRAIEACRTAFLGGHIDQCDCCGKERNSYNSCRNRNCPKCQSLAKAQWLEARMAELLPTSYYHVVFTVPEEVASLVTCNNGFAIAPSGCLWSAQACLRFPARLKRSKLPHSKCHIPGHCYRFGCYRPLANFSVERSQKARPYKNDDSRC